MILLVILQALLYIVAGSWYGYDGGNNQDHPEWGTSGDKIIRKYPSLAYDYEEWPVSARHISNVVALSKHGWTHANPRNISGFLTVWGQFILHDMVYTEKSDEDWPIEVPKGDPVFDPDYEGGKTIGFKRSVGKKEKINENTCWIDGSPIYGSKKETNSALRAYEKGLLRVSEDVDESLGEFPPYLYELPEELQDKVELDNDVNRVPTKHLFALGDPRANAHPLLLALHVLFWREHNRVARVLHHKNPDWDDDKLYSAARRYVIAEIQHITFEEYLFWLFARPFPAKDFYDPECDPRVHIFFSTVAFRYGHSEIGDLITNAYQGRYGKFPYWHAAKLADHFFDSEYVTDVELSDVFEGLAGTVQQSVDHEIADSVRNDLFKNHKQRFDLFSIDIQRGRDHKIPSYNHARLAYGLEPFDSWEDFNSLDEKLEQDEHEIKHKLSTVYRNPWEADSIVAGLAANWVRTPYTKRHHDYSNIGDLFEAAIISQFQRTRTGDRFWYTRHLDFINCYGDLEPVQHRFLADVIRDNIYHVDIPDDVFKVWDY